MGRISTRLTLALLAMLLAVGAATLAITLVTTHLHGQQVQQELNRGLAHALVEEQLPLGPDGVQRQALDSIFHSLMVINPDIEVYLLDPSGRILEYSAPHGRVVRDRVALGPIEAFLRSGGEAADGGRLPIFGDDPRSRDDHEVFSVAPVEDGEGHRMGYLYVVLSGEKMESIATMVRRSHIVRLGLATAAACVLLALAAGGLLFRRLTRRLRSLAKEMGDFRSGRLAAAALSGDAGDSAATLAAREGDEIDQLRGTFLRMAQRIEEQIDQLQENDRLRRELVANVSHDLRTPITHLQGYLETLQLKEELLAPDERREYLEIAAQQAARLGRLVGDLFELARLDARQAPLDIEVFSMAELVQDVVQKFEVPAAGRGVRIEPELAASPGIVSADLDLIERVLDNLIGNAVRHTPAGGRVTVAVRELPASDKIAVEVRDTGSGIAQADLPYIFDRFYRAGHQPGDADAGSGLGLAIARRVLELHASDLDCESAPGEGATFRFSLQVPRRDAAVSAVVTET